MKLVRARAWRLPVVRSGAPPIDRQRHRSIPSTDVTGYLARNRKFESTSLQRRVRSELLPGRRSRGTVSDFRIGRRQALVTIVNEATERAKMQISAGPARANHYWIPNVIRRIQNDDEICAAMQRHSSEQPSPGVKVSFPRVLGRARGMSDELRAWCVSECERAKTDVVGEVGLDLVTGQARLVALSLYDLLAGPEA